MSDPKELEKIREREFDITKERIQKILNAGANVILTTKGIDDMSLKYFVEAGAIACRRVPKEDLRYQCLAKQLLTACPLACLTAHNRAQKMRHCSGGNAMQQRQHLSSQSGFCCNDLLAAPWELSFPATEESRMCCLHIYLRIVPSLLTVRSGGCRRVAKSTGASVVTTLADMDGKESFDASSLGQADEVSTNSSHRSAVWHGHCHPATNLFSCVSRKEKLQVVTRAWSSLPVALQRACNFMTDFLGQYHQLAPVFLTGSCPNVDIRCTMHQKQCCNVR